MALLFERCAPAVGDGGGAETGAAYLPIDPANPPPRVAFMLGDAVPGLPQRLRSRLAEHDADHRCRRCFSGYPEHAPTILAAVNPSRLHPVHLGRYRRAQRRGIASQRHQAVRITAGTPVGGWVCAVSFYGFDASAWRSGSALLGGGRLVIVPSRWRPRRATFMGCSWPNTSSVLTQTPAAVHVARRRVWRSVALVVAGERHVRQRWWIGGRPGVDAKCLWPNRDHDLCGDTVRRCDQVRGCRRLVFGVGAALFVLDGWLRPVPARVAGSCTLPVRASVLGISRAGLTASRFVACPFGGSGARMYRTPIWYCWRADGQLGWGAPTIRTRSRGYRIELGEVATALAELAGVGQAVVIAVVRPGDSAWWVCREIAPGAVDPAGCGRNLLSGYLGASRGGSDRCAPLTVNGKLDHRALPAGIR